MFLEKEWTCACTPWFDLYKWAKLHDMNNPNSSKVCSSKYLMSKFTCFCFHLSRMVFFFFNIFTLASFILCIERREELNYLNSSSMKPPSRHAFEVTFLLPNFRPFGPCDAPWHGNASLRRDVSRPPGSFFIFNPLRSVGFG